MIHQPVFYAHLGVRILTADRVLIVFEEEGRERVIQGAFCGTIAQAIDGTRTVDDLVSRFADCIPPEHVYYVLGTFERAGYLTNAESQTPPAITSFWKSLDVSPDAAIERLANSCVALATFGQVDTAALEQALSQLGIAIAPAAHLHVVLTDDYLHPGLAHWNAQALQRNLPWLLAKPPGLTQWLGPIFRPGVTACWQCLAHRLAANRRATGEPGSASRTSRAALPTTLAAFANLAATEIAKWLVLGASASLEGAVWTLNAQLTATTHLLTRRPTCDACGSPARPPTHLFAFSPGAPVTARHTIQKLERHVSPITGIVPLLQKADLDPHYPGHIYVALQSSATLPRAHDAAVGKGLSADEAMAGCLAEAVERYSCDFDPAIPLIRATCANLAPAALDPATLLHFSARQYRDRNAWNAQHGRLHFIPEPLNSTAPLNWTSAWSFTHQAQRYVPAAYCYFHYPGEDRRYFPCDSNGCASGNTLAEALLHAALELIERDAVALWWYNRAQRPALRTDSFHDAFLSAAACSLRRAGRELVLLNLTTDFNIPCVAAVSSKIDGTRIVLGSAADPDPRTAALRAVSEVTQMLEYSAREAALDTARQSLPGDVSHWLRTATLSQHPYLTGSSEISAHDLPTSPRDFQTCRAALERAGFEVLALNLTKPEFDLPTVRVVVPGLRHFWARFAPGRLYDVPVQLGWIPRPLTEAELNPVPYML